MDPFHALWSRFHSGSVPVSHLLTEYTGWNLTRFHLLPDGRNAVYNHNELRGLLDRFNTLGAEILGENAPCWIVVPQIGGLDGYSADSAAVITEKHILRARLRRLKTVYGMEMRWEFHSTSDQANYSVFAAETIWRKDAFNRLFLHLYKERLADILWMNPETGAVFAPYDAGVDLSAPTPEALIDIVSRYYGWLPDNGTGFLQFNPKQMKSASFTVGKSCAAAIQKAINPPQD